MTPAEYIKAVKARINVESDYEFGKRFGVSDKHLPEIKNGTRAVPLDVAFKLAIALEMDPAEVVADLASQREKNADRRGFWTSFISHARTASVLLVCMLAWSFSGISGADQKTGVGFFRFPRRA